MDNTNVKREIDTLIKNQKNKFTLENVLIIDFMKAIENNDPKAISEDMTIEELDNLYIDFSYEYRDEKEDYVDIQIEEYIFEIRKLISLVELLEIFWGVEEQIDKVIKMFDAYGYKVGVDNTEEDLEPVFKYIKIIERKIKQLKINNVTPKLNSDKKNNIYLTLARLSKSLKFELDYNNLTVIKFIYYIKTLKEDE